MTTTTASPSLVDLYRQVVATYNLDLDMTPEQREALDTSRKAWLAAREQVETAGRSRKDKEQRLDEAKAILKVAGEAYEAAQQVEKEAERDRYKEALAVAEELWAGIARQAFGTDVLFVNSVPTGETTKDYYGEHSVWRTTVDAQPIPLRVRGFESGDFVITPRANTITDLSFEVSALTDEVGENNVRERSFGRRASVQSTAHRRSGADEVEVSWPSIGSQTIEGAEVTFAVIELTIKVARIVAAIKQEVEAK